jgi:hypothetical protein
MIRRHLRSAGNCHGIDDLVGASTRGRHNYRCGPRRGRALPTSERAEALCTVRKRPEHDYRIGLNRPAVRSPGRFRPSRADHSACCRSDHRREPSAAGAPRRPAPLLGRRTSQEPELVMGKPGTRSRSWPCRVARRAFGRHVREPESDCDERKRTPWCRGPRTGNAPARNSGRAGGIDRRDGTGRAARRSGPVSPRGAVLQKRPIPFAG